MQQCLVRNRRLLSCLTSVRMANAALFTICIVIKKLYKDEDHLTKNPVAQVEGDGGKPVQDDKDISYTNLKALIEKSKDLLLVDVRSKDEVDRGRIAGSIHIPVDEVEKAFSLDSNAFQEKFGKPKPQLDAADLVFHCQLGRRGAAATDKARGLGFKNARNYTGGYKEWSEKECK